jgi:DnaJ-class molecular chaperone
MRKAYHRLSLNVHPDKLRGVGEATRAFQAVVTAFERLSEPEEEDAAEGYVWVVLVVFGFDADDDLSR